MSQYAGVIQNLNQMQATLAGAKPFVFGFDAYPQLESDSAAQTGILSTPGQGDTPIGGHDVTVCGYNASGNPLPGFKPGNTWPSDTFLFRNHWVLDDGTPWGDLGYGYIPFGYATNARWAADFWVIDWVLKGRKKP